MCHNASYFLQYELIMSFSSRKIIEQFPTERLKRFSFPIRPFFTLGSFVFFTTMFFLGALPLAWAIVFTAAFAFDDLPLTPFIRLLRAANNLYHHRKQLKSIITMLCITLGALVGGFLAYFYFIHQPLFMFGMAFFVFGTGCSPIWIFLGGVIGAIIADITKQITPLFGITVGFSLGFMIGFSLPITFISPVVSAVFIASVSCAFLGSVIAKEGLRLYYYLRYGHSNADGYYLDRTPEKQAAFIANQANQLHVSIDTFKRLTTYCMAKIKMIKTEASLMHAITSTNLSNPWAIFYWLWDEFTLKQHYQTNAYKDIYHRLMAETLNSENVEAVKELLKNSTSIEKKDTVCRPAWPYIFSGERQHHLKARTFFHQCNLIDSGGIQADLIEPFLASPQ